VIEVGGGKKFVGTAARVLQSFLNGRWKRVTLRRKLLRQTEKFLQGIRKGIEYPEREFTTIYIIFFFSFFTE
jgi:hypothetical protein